LSKLLNKILSIRDRVLIFKSLILSKIWYFIPAALPNYKIKHEITLLILKYIKSSVILPAYSDLAEHIMLGGMSAPDISNSINAILAKQFLALLTSKANWAKIAKLIIEAYLLKFKKKTQSISIFGIKLNEHFELAEKLETLASCLEKSRWQLSRLFSISFLPKRRSHHH
jgi:hypothetical protein